MTSPERRDPYIVLGVTREASAAEIARAYRRAARASHPDSGVAGSADRFRVVSDAYDQLRDPRRRATYDRSHPLIRPPATGTPGRSVRYAAPGSQHVVLGIEDLARPPGVERGLRRPTRFLDDRQLIRVEVWKWRTC